MYGRIYHPGMGPPCGAVSTPGAPVFVPGVLGLQIRCVYGIFLIRRWDLILSPGGADSTNLSQSAISRWGWGFHTVRGGIDPGDRRVLPGCVGVANIWKDFSSLDGTLSSPGALAQQTRADQHNQSVRLGFSRCAGRYLPGGSPFIVPGVLELQMHGEISRPKMESYPLWVELAPQLPEPINQPTNGVGVSTPCGAISTWGIIAFVPGYSQL